MAGQVFKHAIVTAGAVLALGLPAVAAAADCPPGPAIASRLPTGGPAPRLAMARATPKAAPARKPAARKPRPAAAASAAARPHAKRPRLAKARAKPTAVATSAARRPHRAAAAQPTTPWLAATNLAQAQTAGLFDPTACAGANAIPDLAAPALRLSMARSAAPAEADITPMPADFGAVDDTPTGGPATPGNPNVPTPTPDVGGPTVILPPDVMTPATPTPTTPQTPTTLTPPLSPPVAPTLTPGGDPRPGVDPLPTPSPFTPTLARPPIDPGTGTGGPVTGGPGTGGPGTDHPGAVPEPSTWALLIAGFGLTGAALRRRTRAAG